MRTSGVKRSKLEEQHIPYLLAATIQGGSQRVRMARCGFTASPNQIGRMTTAGDATLYAVPSPNAYPHYITAGPDGALWCTEANKQNRANHHRWSSYRVHRVA